MLEIVLPWPDNALQPNGGKSSLAKSSTTKVARDTANWLTKAAFKGKGRLRIKPKTPIYVNTIFHAKDNRKGDLKNMDAACKAYYDGIADALGVDDRYFVTNGINWGENKKGGSVVVLLSWEAAP